VAEAPHLPPVSPSLPDMHSSTTSYVALQNLYKRQYMDDLQKFATILLEVLKEADLQPEAIPSTEIESFVKNIGGVDVIKGTSLLDAKQYEGGMKQVISGWLGAREI
jgi:amyloid beta precursor protein binding protein 1